MCNFAFMLCMHCCYMIWMKKRQEQVDHIDFYRFAWKYWLIVN